MTTLAGSTAAADTPAAPVRPGGRTDAPARPPTREQRQQGDDFDRLLRRKCEEPEEEGGAAEGEADTEAPQAPCLVALTSWMAAPAPPSLAQATPAKAASSLPSLPMPHSGAQVAQAAFEAAASAQPQPPAAPTPGTEAGAWQVTLNDPQGLAVEFRVSRPAGCGAESAPWALTIAAGPQGAAVLARHAQRLNERLRARSVELAHLRIESDEEPPQSD